MRQDGERQRRAAVRHRLGRAEHAQQPLGRAGSTASPSVLLIITKQGDANVIETVDRIRALLPELKRWIPAGIDISRAVRPHRHHPRQRADMQLTLAATIVLVMLVVFVFLRRRHADARGRRHGAAVARRHLRGDVVRRASRSTISR